MPVLPIRYPLAIWKPLLNHSAPGTIEQKREIVLHVTDGPTLAGAIASFTNSVYPNRTSAHLIGDRDGSITQLLDLRDTAWHADEANGFSIGIEHVALTEAGAASLNKKYARQIAAGTQKPFVYMPATDAQYESSARLVAWLCRLIKVPCDRAHVREHCEVDKSTTHALCCHGALDPDRLVTLARAF